MFGAVRYINLDKRTDRKKEIESELRRMGIPNFKRFPAVNHRDGAIGCAYSHLNLLKEAKNKKYKNILILEDDFEFIVSKKEFWKLMEATKDIDYDVIMLGYQLNKHEDYNDTFYKVLEAQTASAYLVNSGFYDKLIKNLEDAVLEFEKTGQHWNYANDQCWKSLQPISKWYAFRTRIGKQRPSFSDNKGEKVNYHSGGKRRKTVRRKRTRTY
jgi:glycosyl transferase, family 25